MSEPEATVAEILVHLVRPGVGIQDYQLTDGATLADLLRVSGVSGEDQAVYVGGVRPEEALPLLDGLVVTVVPRLRNAVGGEPWRAAVPAFRDEALFREYLDTLEARRAAEDPRE